MALGTTFLNACGLSLQKLAHKRLAAEAEVASASSDAPVKKKPIYRNPLWGLGLAFMVVGSIASLGVFAILGQARAASFAAVGIAWSAILSALILREHLTWVDGLTTVLIVTGCTVAVIFGSDGAEGQSLNTMDSIVHELRRPISWKGALVVLAVVAVFITIIRFATIDRKKTEAEVAAQKARARNMRRRSRKASAWGGEGIPNPNTSSPSLGSVAHSDTPHAIPNPVYMDENALANGTITPGRSVTPNTKGENETRRTISFAPSVDTMHSDALSSNMRDRSGTLQSTTEGGRARAGSRRRSQRPPSMKNGDEITKGNSLDDTKGTAPVRLSKPKKRGCFSVFIRRAECFARCVLAGIFSGTTGLASKFVVVGLIQAGKENNAMTIVGRWEWWILLICLPLSLVGQLRALNSALAIFDALEAVPIYQSSIALVGLVFGWVFLGEAEGASTKSLTVFAIGCAVSCSGVLLLMFKKRLLKLIPLPPVVIPTIGECRRKCRRKGIASQSPDQSNEVVEPQNVQMNLISRLKANMPREDGHPSKTPGYTGQRKDSLVVPPGQLTSVSTPDSTRSNVSTTHANVGLLKKDLEMASIRSIMSESTNTDDASEASLAGERHYPAWAANQNLAVGVGVHWQPPPAGPPAPRRSRDPGTPRLTSVTGAQSPTHASTPSTTADSSRIDSSSMYDAPTDDTDFGEDDDDDSYTSDSATSSDDSGIGRSYSRTMSDGTTLPARAAETSYVFDAGLHIDQSLRYIAGETGISRQVSASLKRLQNTASIRLRSGSILSALNVFSSGGGSGNNTPTGSRPTSPKNARTKSRAQTLDYSTTTSPSLETHGIRGIHSRQKSSALPPLAPSQHGSALEMTSTHTQAMPTPQYVGRSSESFPAEGSSESMNVVIDITEKGEKQEK